MGSQDDLISKEFLLELNRLVSLTIGCENHVIFVGLSGLPILSNSSIYY
jgi:hypothetical protein